MFPFLPSASVLRRGSVPWPGRPQAHPSVTNLDSTTKCACSILAAPSHGLASVSPRRSIHRSSRTRFASVRRGRGRAWPWTHALRFAPVRQERRSKVAGVGTGWGPTPVNCPTPGSFSGSVPWGDPTWPGPHPSVWRTWASIPSPKRHDGTAQRQVLGREESVETCLGNPCGHLLASRPGAWDADAWKSEAELAAKGRDKDGRERFCRTMGREPS